MDRGGAYYYVYDGLGSVRALTNSGGTVTDTYAYDAFGNTTHGLGSSPNPYQFNGQALDSTGLYFLRARYYNPGDGRFLSQDPLMGSDSDPASLHRYLYASGDPVNRMDPSGREDFSLTGVLAATSIANSLGGILDAAEFAIKDQFAAAAGVDISMEKVIATTIVDSAGLSNDWVAPLQQSVQNLEMALLAYQIVSGGANLYKAAKQANGNPPFSKFSKALSGKDNSLADLAGEADDASASSEESELTPQSGPGCNTCLIAGSVVEMADGTTKAIERLQPHDRVLSRNPETGETEPEFVTQTISRKTAVLVTLVFTDSRTGEVADKMVCTPEHPIFVQSKGWVPAGMLVSGDLVVTRNKIPLMVGTITWQRDEKHGFTVYNLTIEDDHTYFVGIRDGGIWVHNVPCGDWTSPEGLVYGRDRLYGNRIFHLFHHLAEDPVRIANGQTHSIFKVDTSLEAIDLVDQAWKTRVGPGILQSNGNTQFIVPMGRDVGTVGERNINVIVRIQSGVNKFISAFPSL